MVNKTITCEYCGCIMTINEALVHNRKPLCILCATDRDIDAEFMNGLGDKALLDILGFVPKREKPV